MKYLIIGALISGSVSLMQCSPASSTNDETEITYADSGSFGLNLLDEDVLDYSGNEFSLYAKIPENGDLVIKLIRLQNSVWFVGFSSISNWNVSDYNWSEKSQTFTAISGNIECDLKLEMEAGKYRIEYYENGSSEITFSKEIEI